MSSCCKEGHLVRPYIDTYLNDVNNAMLLSNQIETVEKKKGSKIVSGKYIFYYLVGIYNMHISKKASINFNLNGI